MNKILLTVVLAAVLFLNCAACFAAETIVIENTTVAQVLKSAASYMTAKNRATVAASSQNSLTMYNFRNGLPAGNFIMGGYNYETFWQFHAEQVDENVSLSLTGTTKATPTKNDRPPARGVVKSSVTSEILNGIKSSISR